MPIELVTKIMLESMKMELEKSEFKDKLDEVSAEEKVNFINDYMKSKALLSMYAISHGITNIEIEK